MLNFLDQNNHYNSVQFHYSIDLYMYMYVKDSEWLLTRASKLR